MLIKYLFILFSFDLYIFIIISLLLECSNCILCIQGNYNCTYAWSYVLHVATYIFQCEYVPRNKHAGHATTSLITHLRRYTPDSTPIFVHNYTHFHELPRFYAHYTQHGIFAIYSWLHRKITPLLKPIKHTQNDLYT